MDRRLSSPSNPSGAAPSLPSSEPSSSRNPQQSSQRPSSSSSSSSTRNSGGDANNNNRRLSMQTQQQRRTSNIPRPAPIPIPEPISVGNPDSMTSSGEGPSSTSTTNSALAGVSAELIQHISTGLHSHSSSISPTSPKETNNLLGDGSDTPRSHSSPRGASTLPRPRSAVETTSSSTLPGGNGFGIQYDAINNRPHSSADAWGVRPPSVYSASNDGTHLGPNSRSQSPSADSMLRVSSVPRSRSSNFINTPSPLNPNALPLPRRPGSTMSRPPSMVLYRLAGIGDDFNPQMSSLSPPVTTNSRRASRFSTLSSANSSVFGDSKYPVPAGEDGMLTPPPSGAFLAYEYDPSLDLELPDDAEDVLHNPDPPGKKDPVGSFTFRGLCNILMVVLIPLILITLFVLYPVISYFDSNARSSFVAGTDHGTNPQGGNSPTVSTTRGPDDLIDPDTPDSAKTWSSSVNGDAYKLVFSDEFKLEGRTFGTDQDPFWEAVDLHDAKNRDLNYYQPEQVTTQGGHLVITLEERTTNGLQYVSGMLQSWNKFCFTGGYVEVGVSLPGSGTVGGFNTQAYTMGNLARSGYPASEEGIYPYSYNACDDAILAQQNGAAGSTLPAQRLSGCTCPIERTRGNHPGPTGAQYLTGRGSPHIDILGHAFDTGEAGVVSQGFRVAPMTPGLVVNDGQSIQSAGDSKLNTYLGNDKAQIVSALTNIPAGSYSSGGAQFTSFGYEHVPNADDQSQAALHFMRGGTSEMYRVTGASVPADGAALEQRLISNEPMYIVLGLALSQVFAAVDTSQLTFPAKLMVDYVRVYQRDGQDSKIGCNPTDFPTKDYIEKHSRAYSDSSLTTWADVGYDTPTNAWVDGC